MVIVPLLAIAPDTPLLARMPIALFAPLIVIVPALVTALSLLIVTAVPEVGVIEPALVMLMSAAVLPVPAVAVETGVVWDAPMVTTGLAAEAAEAAKQAERDGRQASGSEQAAHGTPFFVLRDMG